MSQLATARINAEVKAVAIELKSGSGFAQYIVPTGKVLVIEHVAFCDVWVGKPMVIRIQHSVNPVGSVWNTTMTYSQYWNSLLRPIRLPANKGIFIDSSYGIQFKCFLYGLLVDEADLYAGIPGAMGPPQIAASESGTRVSGTVALASPRPSRVVVQQTEDLNAWQTAPASVQGAGGSPAQKTFEASLPSTSRQAFFRAQGKPGFDLLELLSPVSATALTVEDLQ